MPLLWLGLSFVSGIFIAALLPQFSNVWGYALMAALVVVFLEYKLIPTEKHVFRSSRIFKLPIGLLLTALSLGAMRFQASQPEFTPDDLAYYQPLEDARIQGVIISYPQISQTSSTAIVRADEITFNGQRMRITGKLELRLPPGFHLMYGDRLMLEGSLDSTLPKGSSIYSSYLARRYIYNRMAYPQIELIETSKGNPLTKSIYQIRTRARELLNTYLPARESSLLSGILLGIDWLIPRYLEDAYRATGTVHIIAISGFNITLIAWQIIHLFRRFFRPVSAAVLAILAISFYTFLVGADPAVVRAAVMGSLAIPAYFLGRRLIGIHSLTIAAAVMLAFNPFLLWEVGFQLSFLATLGLMVLADPLIGFLTARISIKWGEIKARNLQPLLILVIPTLAAQFAVSPVLFHLDRSILPYSLPANLLILPLQPLLMTISGLGVLIGLLSPPLGGLVLMLTRPIAAFCNQAAMRIGMLPSAVLPAPASSQWISLIIVAIVLVFASILQIRGIGKPEPEHE
jgi:competence protein ComEC